MVSTTAHRKGIAASGAFGAVKPDNTTITVSGGVAARAAIPRLASIPPLGGGAVAGSSLAGGAGKAATIGSGGSGRIFVGQGGCSGATQPAGNMVVSGGCGGRPCSAVALRGRPIVTCRYCGGQQLGAGGSGGGSNNVTGGVTGPGGGAGGSGYIVVEEYIDWSEEMSET